MSAMTASNTLAVVIDVVLVVTAAAMHGELDDIWL